MCVLTLLPLVQDVQHADDDDDHGGDDDDDDDMSNFSGNNSDGQYGVLRKCPGPLFVRLQGCSSHIRCLVL